MHRPRPICMFNCCFCCIALTQNDRSLSIPTKTVIKMTFFFPPWLSNPFFGDSYRFADGLLLGLQHYYHKLIHIRNYFPDNQ